MRPGRFDRHIYVPLPDRPARSAIFELQAKKMPFAPGTDFDRLAKLTEGYSGAEIVHICQEAAYSALKVAAESISVSILEAAINGVPARISKSELDYFTNFYQRNST